MMKFYQILIMRAGEKRWAFMAHGAAYSQDEVQDLKASASSNGARIKLLPVKK